MFSCMCMCVLHRILYQLWTGQYKDLLSNHFKAVDQLNAYEKDVVLGKKYIMYLFVYIHTYIHTYLYIYIHTYIHT